MDAVTGYEFTEDQNRQLSKLFRRMRFLAFVLCLSGTLVVVSGCTLAAHLLFSPVPKMLAGSTLVMAGGGVLLVLMGLMLLRAADSFYAIVETAGKDITHLMDALTELRKFFVFSAGLGILMILAMLGIIGTLVFYSQTTPM